MRVCAVVGCEQASYARGWCKLHYDRWRYGRPIGGPLPIREERSASVRFHERYRLDESGCWLWTAGLSNKGYGVLTVNGKDLGAHRFGYELLVGTVPDGLELDHLCRNRACVNPAHLEPVTHAENMRRSRPYLSRVNSTACPHGHSYDDENTIWRVRGERAPHRVCKECGRIAAKEYQRRRRAQVRASA